MTHHKRKKNTRERGDTTHGWGAKKKHRGAGNRGGRGNANSGKRADARKPSFQKMDQWFGKYGFKMKGQIEDIRIINFMNINDNIDKWVSEGKAKFENGVYIVDLGTLGFNKLLSRGTPSRKYKITVKYATSKALENIKSNGEIIVQAE
jgi:large subunit ribosomal protein L15